MPVKIRRVGMATLAILAGAGGGAGCGGDDERPATTQSTSPPVGRAPSATTPPGEEPAPGRDRERPVPGGEEPVRVPASFTLRGGRLVPAVRHVPAFLAFRISVVATDGRAHALTIEADRTYRLRIPQGRRAAIRIPGQPPGRYPVRVNGARAIIDVGGEPSG